MVLLPMLYQLWALVRAVAWRRWARQWHGTAGISAEALTWHLGRDAMTAEANGA